MALKDWKKVLDKENNKKEYYINLGQPYYLAIYKRSMGDGWAVKIPKISSLFGFSISFFKTKKEALKFAKDCMRKN